jgi:hypothetical protein
LCGNSAHDDLTGRRAWLYIDKSDGRPHCFDYDSAFVGYVAANKKSSSSSLAGRRNANSGSNTNGGLTFAAAMVKHKDPQTRNDQC